MKHFLKVFLLFVTLGAFLVLSIILSAVIACCIASFFSIDLDEWGKTMSNLIWLCFSMPLMVAILDKILDYFLPWLKKS